MDKHLKVPFTADEAAALRAGDMVYLTGVVYTARDAAHKRMNDALDRGEQLPVDLSGNVVYYLGPTPARPGRVIGSAGPPPPAAWINMPPACSIWVCAA